MIKITRAEFNRLRKLCPDYIGKNITRHEFNGKVCNVGDWTAFESVLTGNRSSGTTLIFEHIHFEIV